MTYVYVVYGYKAAKEDDVVGHLDPRKEILSVHQTFKGMSAALLKYNDNIRLHKEGKAPLDRFWGYDFIDFYTMKLED